MSGICGIFSLDGRPAAETELAQMTSMLERRGPDYTGYWISNAVGLGNTLLAVAPGMQNERQPLVHEPSGCVVTADARLDYRDELIEALRPDRSPATISDPELILLAYLAWGEDCPARFYGDFAFALWDPRARQIFCARDHFGKRPFCYHHTPGKLFVFASEARAVLTTPLVPFAINKGRVADFLVPALEWIDYTSTFFEGVVRLPPGHTLAVAADGVKVSEFWKPAPGPTLDFDNDDDYRQGFLEVFTSAVDARLRAPADAVAAMLSGGMDSGSVVVVAKELMASRGEGPLPTWSGIRDEGDQSDCQETRAIEAAIKLPSIRPTLLRPKDMEKRIDDLVAGNEEPFDAEMIMLKAIYRDAGEHGVKVVLDGGGGDIALNEGSWIVRLIRSGRLGHAFKEIRGEARFFDGLPLSVNVLRYFRAALAPQFIKRWVQPARDRRRDQAFLDHSIISRDLAKEIAIDERFDRLRAMFPRKWIADYDEERCAAVRPNVSAGLERYSRAAAGAAVDARDPFVDRRVIEFTTRLPGRFLMRDGWRKIILRDLMAGKLPDEVRWARGKHHLGALFKHAVTKHAIDSGRLDITALQSVLAGYVDPAALDRAWIAFGEGNDPWTLHSAHILSVWLTENARRPVVTT